MDGRIVADPTAWANVEKIEAVLAELRRTEPVSWVDPPGYTPFWLIAAHKDVVAVERAPELFTNDPRTVLQTSEMDARLERSSFRTLVHMDGQEHSDHRAATADWFRPRSLRAIEDAISAQARQAVDELVALGGSCDLAAEIGLRYPLRVIMSILGLPPEDYELMLQLTQETFGANDPDMQRDDESGSSYNETFRAFYEYFGELTTQRRANPTDDLATVIATADIGESERMSYYVLIATAGHDTTSYSIAGGMLGLLENPDQLELLRAEPELVPQAVEEMLRWATPVRHFMRTAKSDTEIDGVAIRRGDAVMLSYLSANRDETVFDQPDRFDITRTPNRQLSFGLGPHSCLGLNLARMEMRLLLAEMVQRLDHLELAGEPAYAQSLIVGGVKRLPIRYTERVASTSHPAAAVR